MSFFEKRRRIILTIIIAIVILILMGVSTIPFKNSFFMKNAINTVFTPIHRALSAVSDGVGGCFNYLIEMKNMNKENDRLTEENAQLRHNYRDAESYRKENENLRELLNLKSQGTYGENSIAANIIGWSSDNWYNYYTIDKGSSSGIENNDIVISTDGIVGKVCETGLNWAKISTVIESSSSVGVRVIRTGDVSIAEGDFDLEREGKCKLTFINRNAHIIVGDTLETSGLGENYPAGIPLGKVVEIVADNAGMSRYAVVEPYTDFSDLKFVLVLKN